MKEVVLLWEVMEVALFLVEVFDQKEKAEKVVTDNPGTQFIIEVKAVR